MKILKNKLYNWNKSIMELHNSQKNNCKTNSYRRIVLIKFVNFITLSENRQRIKEEKIKRNSIEIIQKNFKPITFKTTQSQIH